MVEDDGECILQWSGHAGYITERFSGLLARQALVDVTLICEEQKLRVHKLVLASNSVYFEELLEQDLGHEPIIFLRDLNFEILKAMVEFMYCGETTISHECLPSLLAAAKIFKVKELAGIINAVAESAKEIEEFEESSISPSDISESDQMDSSDENECIHEPCNEPGQDRCTELCINPYNDTSLLQNSSLEDTVIVDNSEQKLDHHLYDESCDIESQVNGDFISPDKFVEDMPLYCTNRDLKTIACEHCCDFNGTNNPEVACPEVTRDNPGPLGVEGTGVPVNLGRSVKVYTHKKRKSVEKAESSVEDPASHVTSLPPPTDCIDLFNEPSSTNVPVTLLTSLDIESAEYILSLSTENIQSILGCAMGDHNTLIKYKGESTTDDEKLNVMYNKPVLRRSRRLQQENEEPGNLPKKQIETNKSTKKNCAKSEVRSKRKAKEMDRRVPDENVPHRVTKKNTNSSKTNRSASKLIQKKHKPLCTTIAKEKSETKSRSASTKPKPDLASNVRPLNLSLNRPRYYNVLGYINRALWGDMSDASEELKNEIQNSESLRNTEIPFALGLLPIRTVKEKMQYAAEQQPRKTRSSVAVFKQLYEFNELKRKQCFDEEPKKDDSGVNTNNDGRNDGPKENASAVCRIEIHAAPSKYTKIRKTSHMESVTSATVTSEEVAAS